MYFNKTVKVQTELPKKQEKPFHIMNEYCKKYET